MSTFNDVCKVVQMIQNMKPYFDMIKSSQKRKTTYLIKDVLRMLFLACKDSIGRRIIRQYKKMSYK